jgi:hypothetical protein
MPANAGTHALRCRSWARLGPRIPRKTEGERQWIVDATLDLRFTRPLLNLGSSPRSWGTRQPPCAAAGHGRFIPTPVGNTAAQNPDTGPSSVHPHARGEHGRLQQPAHPAGGSSPRPWGTQRSRCCGERLRRFIPTPVGNTLNAAYGSALISVHPHARGEHARGRCSERVSSRFIPTPVGNTASLDT